MISCIAFRFPLPTAPLLPDEHTHSSGLVVWGYLGRAIPCLMSSEAKISILALEWLGSLWVWLCCVNVHLDFFGSIIYTLKLRGTTKREGRQTNIFRETVRGKNEYCISVVVWKTIFSSCGWGDFWVHGFPSKPVLHSSWKVDILEKVWWHPQVEKIQTSHARARSPAMKQSCCHHTVNLFCWSHSWQLAHSQLPLCRKTQAVSLSVAGLSQPLPPN